MLCATPSYLAEHGTPADIAELSRHTLIAHNADHWRLDGPEGPVSVRVTGPLRTNSSEVVREAIADYAERVGRLSERERRAMLHVFDTLVPALPIRPLREVTAELKSIRTARRTGGRRSGHTQ